MARATLYTEAMFREYREKGYWDETTLSDLWERNAHAFPETEALVDSRIRLSWGEANKWIDRLVLGFLEMGFLKDEVIVIQLPNSVELCLIRAACERAGLLCLPVLRTWREREMAYVLERVGASGVVVPRSFRGFDHLAMIEEMRPRLPHLRHVFVTGEEVPAGALSVSEMVRIPLEERYPPGYLAGTKCRADEFSLIAATTGTTGMPKFVESPICSRIYMAKVFMENFGITGSDVIGVFTPSVGGPNHPAYFSAPLAGAKLAMLEHFSPREAFEIIEKEKVSFAGVVPAQLALMAQEPARTDYDLRSLRCLYSSGAVLPPRLAGEVEDKFHCPVLQCYGAMDSGGMVLHSIDEAEEVRFFTIGRPAEGNEIRLVNDGGGDAKGEEVGEIWARGPTLISGYYGDPEANAAVWTEDGWYRTGDLGRWDEKGRLTIVGRKKDLIIRGGQNIYPAEIEDLLLSHPGVAQVALVKMPDPVMGERACAYAVLRSGGDFTFESMTSYLKGKGVAAYKLPERLEIIETMPMVAEGQKVDKKALERDIADKLQREAAGRVDEP